jgi:hypothetical protein
MNSESVELFLSFSRNSSSFADRAVAVVRQRVDSLNIRFDFFCIIEKLFLKKQMFRLSSRVLRSTD